MTDPDALAILIDAHRRAATEDMRTAEVFAALQQLEAHAGERWPFEQFRRTLGARDLPFTPDAAGRGQVLNASLNGIRRAIGVLGVLLAVLCSACGSSSPTAPATPAPTPTPTPAPAPTPTPILTVQSVACPDVTVGVDVAFYKQIGCNAFDLPLQPVRRWNVAPNVFIQTADIDAATLDMIEATVREMVPRWSNNRFGVGVVERGAGSRQGQDGWISILWNSTLTSCGLSDVAVSGGIVELFPRGGTNCSCNGYAIRPRTVRHELGHALGYWHTDSATDLMSGLQVTGCDGSPSARELQAAAYQYR